MKNIPINKGNYSMEPNDRNELFEKRRGEGWEQEYKEYRERWTQYAKSQYVGNYPILVDIELSSVCNLNCPMCYTITDVFKNKVHAKLMDEELFYKIIDEIGGKVSAIRLSLRGEPTLHPKMIDFIKYAKEKGIKEVSFLTNGSKLNDDYIIDLIESGADWITISVDGINDTYESVRRPIKFTEIYEKIKRFYEIKKDMGVFRPVIKVQGIWPAVRDNVEEYYNIFAPISDLVAFNPLIDYLDNDDISKIVYDDDFSCPMLYQRIVVAADGKVLMCSNDEDNMNIIGDANTTSIYDLWHGDELNKIREIHRAGNFKDVPVCRKCYLPRATEDNEVAYVNGNEIIIKNYVGRTQEIGK